MVQPAEKLQNQVELVIVEREKTNQEKIILLIQKMELLKKIKE